MVSVPVFVAVGVALAALVFGIVLRPLWRARARSAAMAVALLVVAGGGLYLLVGTPQALDPARAAAPVTLDQAIAQLEADLAREPGEAEGWRLLARAYKERAQPAKARDALMRAVALVPDDADLLAEAAEARSLAADARRFDREAVALLEKALAIEPAHQRARWFLGIAQRQAGRHADAAATWTPLLAVVPAGTAASLRTQIDLARADAGLPPLPADAASSAPGASALRVRVSVDPGLAARVPDGATLFVIARQADGAPMPVAVEKLPARGFPVEVALDDADSPMPTAKLSALGEVVVLARLSASGDARRQDGDVESAPVRVALPARGVVELRLAP